MEHEVVKVEAKQKNALWTPVIAVLVGVSLGLIGAFMLWAAFSDTSSKDFSQTLTWGVALAALSFASLSPWKKFNKILAGSILTVTGLWLFTYQPTDLGMLFWAVVLTLIGIRLCFDFFGISLAGQLKEVGNASASAVGFLGKGLMLLMKVIGIGLLIWLAIWLILAIGPLWLIVILLALIVFWLFAH